jgi:phospholipid transport system substrate-binding protein
MLSRRVRSIALILTFILALAPGTAMAGEPTDIVKSTIDNVLRLLSDPALKSQKKHRRQMIKRTIDRHFDYEEMAKRSLGQPWRSLSRAQQVEFVQLFGELLEASYSDKVERYTNEKVDYISERQDDGYAEVRTVVLRANDRIPMDYRLFKTGSRWMVYDVVIEGVSLVSNYRSQFGQIIRQSSYGDLVQRLRTKVNELQSLQKM